jgi:hypothetical protein
MMKMNPGDCCSDGNRNDYDSLDLDGTALHDRDPGTSCGDGAETVTENADYLDNETRIDSDSVHHIVHCDVRREEPTLAVHERSWAAPAHHRDDNYEKANDQAREVRFDFRESDQLV